MIFDKYSIWIFTLCSSNPYCLGLMVVSVYNALIDPTTPGLKDSQKVLEKNNIND